ncbi:MAG: asparagine synthase (glutamine-hydrolyzing) [Cytophagales bacterium]|nr:asparagine synthase (glutamine-hydrolyzing) [Cytophagales bacterium]
MCGITGFLSASKEQKELEKMTNCIVHRGPNASGFFFEDNQNIGLGHRRLSILDLSDSANQPLYSECNRFIIAYNGEVYNFNEIKAEILKEKNVSFQTTSDTEVILEAFALWGEKFVSKLNGMFAISIWDKQEEVLYIFRDRIGIKPIFYYLSDNEFVFGSELKSIKSVFSSLSINQEAIASFLHLGYIPVPQTIYNNVHKFPSGSYAKVKLMNGNIQLDIKKYWKLEDKIQAHSISDEKQAFQSLNNLIESSVKSRMISDVPFGTFLSGGIDSSLVTATASQFTEKPLNTFSIGFEENTHDESQYAKQIAQKLGTNHHEFILSEKKALPLFESILESYDEPYADSSAIPTMLVSSLAKQEVTMILTGDGGDELFHGYGMYDWAERLEKPFISPLKNTIGWGLQTFGNQRMKRAGQVFSKSKHENIHNHIFSQEQYLFSNKELSSLLKKPISFFNYTEEEKLHRKLSSAESQALFDLNYYLQDDLLVKVDRASMKYSLECRVPLLDYRIIELALNIHPNLKKKGAVRKYLLQEVLFSKLPRSLFEREKRGFSIPLAKWLKSDLAYLIDNYLNTNIIEEFGILENKQVQQLVKRFRNGEDFLYNRIWVMLLLHKWLKENK